MMRIGQHVFIVRERSQWSSRLKKMVTTKIRIPGLVRGYDEEKGCYWVRFYGTPNHFTPPGKKYGVYRLLFSEHQLIEREPDYDDPLEMF